MSDWNVNKRLPQAQHLQVMLNTTISDGWKEGL